jgi:hypothetical protein
VGTRRGSSLQRLGTQCFWGVAGVRGFGPSVGRRRSPLLPSVDPPLPLKHALGSFKPSSSENFRSQVVLFGIVEYHLADGEYHNLMASTTIKRCCAKILNIFIYQRVNLCKSLS